MSEEKSDFMARRSVLTGMGVAAAGVVAGASTAAAQGKQFEAERHESDAWMDEMPGGHSIVADDGSFQSPGLAKGESWTHTFDEPGTHSYSIKEHPKARGSITVE